MAISAINSVNINSVAFKGTQVASKASAQVDNENFVEENKEALLGFSAIGLAVLGVLALHRKGQADKAAEAATAAVDKVSQTTQEAIASISDRHYQGTIGASNIQKIKNAVEAANANKLVNEAEARHVERAKDAIYNDPDKLAEVLETPAHTREQILNWAKVEGLI